MPIGLAHRPEEKIIELSLTTEPGLVDPDEAEILASFRAMPTEDDLPYDNEEPMETARHREQMHVLIDSLQVHWAERTGYYVGGKMFLHHDPADKRRTRGPDFFLVLDVADRERKSWVVWQEGMRFPDVIIELLSKGTVLPTPIELAQQEHRRAAQAKQRADQAEQLLERY